MAFGLDASEFGSWVGASVHDVAQVVAVASADSERALHAAIIVKLTRVSLLAPRVAAVAFRRRRSPAESSTSVVPWFVVGFVGLAAVRSVGLLPANVVVWARSVRGLIFTTALVALGAAVRPSAFRVGGVRPLLLALAAWVVILTTSLAGITLAGS